MTWHSPSGARRAALLAVGWVAITRIAWTIAEALGRRGVWLDTHLDEAAPLLDLARRASRGEWSGRDFDSAHGPLMELVAWVGSGLGMFGPAGTSVGIEVVVAAVALSAAVPLARRAAETPIARVLLWLFAAVGATWLATCALPVVLSLLAVVLLSPGSSRSVAVSAALVVATHLVSGPAGLLAIAACVLALVANRSFASLRTFGTVTLGLHVVLALALAPALGTTWTRLVPGAIALASPPAAVSWDARETGGEAVLVLLAIAVFTLVWGAKRRALRPPAMALLAAGLPLACAARGPDAIAVFSGAFPIAFALAAAALSDETPRLRPGSRALALAAGLFLVGWLAGHPSPLRPLAPTSFRAAWTAFRDRGSRPRSETVRALRRARTRLDRGASACLSAAPHPRIASWLSGVPDRIETPDPLRRVDCPIHLHRLSPGGSGPTGPLLADDIPALAERYEAIEPLGPDFLVMHRRAEDVAAQTRRIGSRRLGHTLAPRGRTILVPFDTPVESEHLVFVDFSLQPGAWGWLLGAPRVGVAFHRPDGLGPTLGVAVRPGRDALVLAISGSAAQTRWLRGGTPGPEAPVDGLAFVFADSTPATRSARIVVHALRELRAGGQPATGVASECEEHVTLSSRVAEERAWYRGVPPRASGDEILFPSGPRSSAQTEVFFPLVPCSNRCLSGSIRSRDRDRSRARLEVDVLDGVRRTRLSSLPVASQAPFLVPLRSWNGREVQLRVALRDPAHDRRSEVALRALRIADCACGPADFVAAVGRGEARVHGVEVRGQSLYAHPARPDAPPTEVLVTVSPCADACLTTALHLGAPAGRGDGVDFEIDVVHEASAHRIAFEHVAPGDPPRPLVVPLARWAGREIQVRLTTHPGSSVDFDWASFVTPAVGTCPK